MTVAFRVNGEDVRLDVPDRTLLIHALRDHLRLTGAHMGCDTSQCGACTVLIDGVAAKSCAVLAVQAEGCEVLSVEGLAQDRRLHPMQAAFAEHHGLQCGFCTPGMIMAGVDIARRRGAPDEATVRAEIAGNLCRCTGYQNIVKAIAAGCRDMAALEAGVRA
jgi:carbon-monoxide dehydrogenase small subunit